MDISLRHESVDNLTAYAEISIAFSVERVLVHAPEFGPTRFREKYQDPPFTKDYDAEPDGHPSTWPRRFDTSAWTAISAWRGQQRLGGLVIAFGSDAVVMLEGRRDLAVIWDMRVRPNERRTRVGNRLIEAAENWARSKGCSRLKVETQNINVPACRFYAKNGFRIASVDLHAYPDLPGEIQLLWYKDL